MNLVLLLSIIWVSQLPLYTFGKSSSAKVDAETEVTTEDYRSVENVENTKDLRVRRNSFINDDEDDFLINKLSREYVTSNLLDPTSESCNNRNGDVESDIAIENSFRSLFDSGCLEYCRLKVLSDINDMLKCADMQNIIRRDRRAKLNLSNMDDLFMPVRGRRMGQGQAPPQITAEKKGKLETLTSDLFLPHRGRRRMDRNNHLRIDPNPFFFIGKRNGIEFNEKDYFVPNRGKRQRQIDLNNLFSQSGKKVIIPKSHTPLERYPLVRNINSDDRNMIDRQQDLKQLGSEANKDITATAREKLIPRWNNEKMLDKTVMIFAPFNDELSEILKTPDGGVSTNLILTNTPHHDDPPNGFNST